MNVISQLFFAIIITSVTGAIATILWGIMQRLFLKLDFALMYLTLRVVCLFYVIPFGYLLVRLTITDGYLQHDGILQLNFVPNGVMKWLTAVLAVIWLVLSAQCVLEYIRGQRGWRELRRYHIPEDREFVLEEFYRIKKKLKIRKSIRVYRNAYIQSPMVTGIFHTCVVLPDREYDREKLTVIFYHELTHYKSMDLLYMLCGVSVGLVQHLNSFSDRLLSQLREWSECDCDRKAIAAMQDEMSAVRYFEVILDIMEDSQESKDEEHIFSMLYRSRKRLERRIDYMKKYTKQKRAVKVLTSAMTFLFTMLGVSTAYAAGAGFSTVHDYIYKSTEVIAEETNVSEELEEHFLPAEEDDTYSRIVYEHTPELAISPLLDENTVETFEWVVTPDVRHVSDKIKLKEGQKVVVSSTAVPAELEYWIGIMNSDGDVRFVQGTNAIAHTFTIYEDDTYRVLVQNRDIATITATGSFYYYTPDETE